MANVEAPQPTKYIWNEPDILKEIEDYVLATYKQHYAKGNDGSGNKIQFTEYFEQKHGLAETVGALRFNSGKYLDRYGKKDGYNRADLLKAAHYLVMLLAVDKEIRK